MSLVTILLAGGSLLALALLFSYVLCWANQAFYVEVDPRIEAICAALPGANCGGCGCVGCGEYAEAVVNKGAPVNCCAPGGAAAAAAIAKIMGVAVDTSAAPKRPVVHCGATTDLRLGQGDYLGEQSCAAATNMAGVQGCKYGCLGFGDCVRACKYDAINVQQGLATVNYERCVGCGACVRACPRNIISLVPFTSPQMYVVTCSNRETGPAVKEVCQTGCIGCKACTKKSDLCTMEGNLAAIDYENFGPDKLTELVAAAEKCPTGSIRLRGNATA